MKKILLVIYNFPPLGGPRSFRWLNLTKSLHRMGWEIDVLTTAPSPNDNFYDAIQPLVDWKRKTGFRVDVVRTSQLGASPTDSDVKAYVQQCYDTWSDPALDYLLLVGDTDFTPIHME